MSYRSPAARPSFEIRHLHHLGVTAPSPLIPSAVLRPIAGVLGSAVASVRRCEGDGWTATSRVILQLADGRSCFAKHALNETTAAWLRVEAANYAAVPSSRIAEMLAFIDGDRPTLVLEDLSSARWPPPWTGDHLTRAHEALDELAATPTAAMLIELPRHLDQRGGWRVTDINLLGELLTPGVDPIEVAEDLDARAREVDARGGELVLLDARSGNVCITASGPKWVDLDGLCRGNNAIAHALLDISAATTTVADPSAVGYFALVSALWAEQLGRPSPEWAPGLREREISLLRSALTVLLGADAVR